MKRIHRILLALLSALLLSIPFSQWGTGLVLMVAFVPLLFIEEHIAGLKKEQKKEQKVTRKKEQKGTRRRGSVIWYAYLAFGLFVILTTFWVMQFHVT